MINSKTLMELSDMLNEKFKIQRELDRMECLDKANTIKSDHSKWKVLQFTKAIVRTQLSQLYLLSRGKLCWNWESWKDMPKIGPSREAFRWEMAQAKNLMELKSKFLMMCFPYFYPTLGSLTSGKGIINNPIWVYLKQTNTKISLSLTPCIPDWTRSILSPSVLDTLALGRDCGYGGLSHVFRVTTCHFSVQMPSPIQTKLLAIVPTFSSLSHI